MLGNIDKNGVKDKKKGITYAANGYDFAMHVAKLFNHRKQLKKSDEVIQAFKSKETLEGVSGPFKYHANKAKGEDYFEFKVVLKQIRNGKIEVVDRS